MQRVMFYFSIQICIVYVLFIHVALATFFNNRLISSDNRGHLLPFSYFTENTSIVSPLDMIFDVGNFYRVKKVPILNLLIKRIMIWGHLGGSAG